MTDHTTILCKRCGFANTPGDQFCGSCGAFLEWEGQVAGDPATSGAAGTPVTPAPVTPAPVTPVTPSMPLTPVEPPATLPTRVAPMPSHAPTAPGASVSASGAPDGGGDLVRCPSCGIANPASRTFCQSCGTTLAAASRIAEPSPDMIAAAVAATPTPIHPVSSPGGRPAVRDKPGSGGFPMWILAVGLIGILVGVGIVVVGPMLAGKGPASGATSGPSGAGSLAPSAGASGVAGGGTTSAPTQAPKAVKLTLTGAMASSVVGDRAKFQPEKAIDGDLKTSWQEGSAKEQGQWIEVTFEPARADTLVIRNGYQASTPLYQGNLRLKDIQVSVDGGEAIAFHLKDTTRAQRIDLGGRSGATSVRITIVTTYPSVKTSIAGTPFDDAAVSEISVLGIPGG